MAFDPDKPALVGLGSANSVFRSGKHTFPAELFNSPAVENGEAIDGLLALREDFGSDSFGYLCISTLIRELEIIQPDDTFKLCPLVGFNKTLRENLQKVDKLTCGQADKIFWDTLKDCFTSTIGSPSRNVELTLDVRKVYARRYDSNGKPDNRRSVIVTVTGAKYV